MWRGDGGKIFTSTDLVTWAAVVPLPGSDLYSVSFPKDTFVATGAGGALLTSLDGSTWTVRNSDRVNGSPRHRLRHGFNGRRRQLRGRRRCGYDSDERDGTIWNPVTPPPLIPGFAKHYVRLPFRRGWTRKRGWARKHGRLQRRYDQLGSGSVKLRRSRCGFSCTRDVPCRGSIGGKRRIEEVGRVTGNSAVCPPRSPRCSIPRPGPSPKSRPQPAACENAHRGALVLSCVVCTVTTLI